MTEEFSTASVENDLRYSFQDAVIIKQNPKLLTIQIDFENEIVKGIIFKESLNPDCKKFIQKTEGIGKVIQVRYHYTPTDSKQLPVFTQRKNYKVNDEENFFITKEDDKYIYGVTDEDFEYRFKKAIWEKGPKYTKQKIGSKIRCKVVKVMWGNSLFERIHIENPYFEQIENW